MNPAMQGENPEAQDPVEAAGWAQAEEKIAQEDSKINMALQSPIFQGAAGYAQMLPAPRIWNLAATGVNLAKKGAHELGNYARETVGMNKLEGPEYEPTKVPTTYDALEWLGEQLGVDVAPKGFLAKASRTAGELSQGVPTQGTKELAQNIGGAIAGGLSEQALIEAGVPEFIAGPLASILGAVAQKGKVGKKNLGIEEQKYRDIAEKHELRKFAGMEDTGTPKLVQPTATKVGKENLREELTSTSRKAVNKIVEEDIPLAKAISEGHDAQKLIQDAYSDAYSKARKETKPVDMSSYVDWINNKIASIKKLAPDLSPESELLIKKLEKAKSSFTEVNPNYKGTTSKILDAQGNPIPHPPTPTHVSKKVSAEEILNQNKEYNKTVENIYRKTEFSGSENAVKNLVGEMKSELAKTLDAQGMAETAKSFKGANSLNSQMNKINDIYDILEPGLQDPKKMAKILNSNKGKALAKDLSPKALGQVNAISQYAQKVEQKIFDNIKTVPSFLDDMKSLGAIGALTIFGSKVAGLKIIKDTAARARGIMMTRDASRMELKNFMQVAQTGKVNAIKSAGARLEKAVEKDFGSVDNFMKFMEEESDSK